MISHDLVILHHRKRKAGIFITTDGVVDLKHAEASARALDFRAQLQTSRSLSPTFLLDVLHPVNIEESAIITFELSVFDSDCKRGSTPVLRVTLTRVPNTNSEREIEARFQEFLNRIGSQTVARRFIFAF